MKRTRLKNLRSRSDPSEAFLEHLILYKNAWINWFHFFIYKRWFGDVSDFLICAKLGVENFDFFPTARRKEDRIDDRTELSRDLTDKVFEDGEFAALSYGLSRRVLAFFNSMKTVLLLLLLFVNQGSIFWQRWLNLIIFENRTKVDVKSGAERSRFTYPDKPSFGVLQNT